MVNLSKGKFKINNWIKFIIASALISTGAEFAEYSVVAPSVFFFITGFGTMATVFVRAVSL